MDRSGGYRGPIRAECLLWARRNAHPLVWIWTATKRKLTLQILEGRPLASCFWGQDAPLWVDSGMQVGDGLPVQARSRSEIDRYGLEGLVLPVSIQGGHARYLTNNSLASLPLLKSTFEVKKKKKRNWETYQPFIEHRGLSVLDTTVVLQKTGPSTLHKND